MPSATTPPLTPPTSTSCAVTSSTCWTARAPWAGGVAAEAGWGSFHRNTCSRCTTDAISGPGLRCWHLSVSLQWLTFLIQWPIAETISQMRLTEQISLLIKDLFPVIFSLWPLNDRSCLYDSDLSISRFARPKSYRLFYYKRDHHLSNEHHAVFSKIWKRQLRPWTSSDPEVIHPRALQSFSHTGLLPGNAADH